MSEFCKDRDLLALEPLLFTAASLPAQQLVAGSDGVLDGATYSSAGSDFVAAGVQAGMVLTTFAAAAAEGLCLEIVEVPSATSLTVSILRADGSVAALPPPAAGASFFIRTFRPQIAEVSRTLARKLTTAADLLEKTTISFEIDAPLRLVTACGVLSGIYLGRAVAAAPEDANWVRSEHYRREFIRLQSELTVVVQTNGDPSSRCSRTFGNVTLRRV